MKFAIITPTFNRYELLKKAIKLVLSQDYENFEMIIIDDSTNSETFENIYKDFSDNRIKYFKNDKNRGVNHSRNRALQNMSKDVDFLVFLDDDDILTHGCLCEAKKII